MCGRFGLKTTFSTLAKLLRAEPIEEHEWGPDFNIAPTDPAPVLLHDEAGRPRLDLFRWGLVPFWADDPKVGARMINARSESVATKPAFRESFAKRRLLVPASGWYEWRKEEAAPGGATAKPQPYWLHAADEELLTFAGIWARWKAPSGEARHTFSILTTDASPATAQIHDRMPVILAPSAHALWLAADADLTELGRLLVPYGGELALHPVAKTVNSVRSDGPDLIAPLLDLGPQRKLSL